jgi:hypothetical protein
MTAVRVVAACPSSELTLVSLEVSLVKGCIRT